MNREYPFGDRTRFDRMMGPSSLYEMWFAAKPDDVHAFEGRISLLVPIGRHQTPIPEPEPEYYDHHDLKLARGLVIARVLSARTIEACERSAALIDEWCSVFDEDEEMAGYGGFVARMASALRSASPGEGG